MKENLVNEDHEDHEDREHGHGHIRHRNQVFRR